MKSYWHRPEETAEAIGDGWFHTGDLGRVDEDGYFYIVDRKKDMIIRGGYNIYPREIEEVLYEHPAVAEAAVIGLPHPALGEEVGAAVTLKAGASVTAEELRDHVKIQVAAYKYPRHVWIVYPRHVWIVDALPKDGFPRTLPQAAAAAELGARLGLTLDAVVYLYAPEPVLTQRSGSAFISPAPWTVAPRRRPTPRGHARQGDRPRDVATVSP